MADGLQISVDASELLALLERAMLRMAQPDELMREIGQDLEANIRLRLTQTKRDAAGQAFAPLAESTKKRYAKKYKGAVPGSLLVRSGLMRDSLAFNSDATSVEVGYSVSYAIFHVTGTRKMPRRDSIFATIAASGASGTLGPQDTADITEIAERFLGDAFE
jgi:phage gpG-like protein